MKDYYTAIISARLDNAKISDLLNEAIKDPEISLKDYQYLTTVAKSLGFSFSYFILK